MFNLASRIILNIVLPEIEPFLKNVYDYERYAVSSIMEFNGTFFDYKFLYALKIKKFKESFNICIFKNDPENEKDREIIAYIKENVQNSEIMLNYIFKAEFHISAAKENIFEKTADAVRIDVSFVKNDHEFIISLIIPIAFFKLFSGNINEPDTDKIEKEITGFFRDPKNIFPELKTVLNSLPEADVQKMFYYLQKKILLTPYQACLMLLSFPEHTPLIKKSLSTNIVNDVNNILKKFSINKRDMAGGIYSIEESIYMALKDKTDFHVSCFFSDIADRLKIIRNTSIYKDFFSWVKEVDTTGQLYQTISITKENDLLNSISDAPDSYYNLFAKYISERKLNELYSVLKTKKVSFTERIGSRASFISNYKKNRIKRLNPGYEKFPALISRLSADNVLYLLFEAGWFVLSAALKEMDKSKVARLTENMPAGARYLIIDVLQGIVNPNIIHDEMQIKKARAVCVNKIMSLYLDGIIDL